MARSRLGMNALTLIPQSQPKSPKTRPIYSTAYANALQLQRLLVNDANDPELRPNFRAQIARAFCELEECKRKLKMRPLPKPVDVSKLGKGKRKAQSGPAYQEPEPKQAPEQAKSGTNSGTDQPKPT